MKFFVSFSLISCVVFHISVVAGYTPHTAENEVEGRVIHLRETTPAVVASRIHVISQRTYRPRFTLTRHPTGEPYIIDHGNWQTRNHYFRNPLTSTYQRSPARLTYFDAHENSIPLGGLNSHPSELRHNPPVGNNDPYHNMDGRNEYHDVRNHLPSTHQPVVPGPNPPQVIDRPQPNGHVNQE